jgi:hypothetical protein
MAIIFIFSPMGRIIWVFRLCNDFQFVDEMQSSLANPYPMPQMAQAAMPEEEPPCFARPFPTSALASETFYLLAAEAFE